MPIEARRRTIQWRDTSKVSRLSAVKRWMYRGDHPDRIAALANRCQAIAASAGIPPKRLVTLEVTGRRSGRLGSIRALVPRS
jgi:hypothetical protein